MKRSLIGCLLASLLATTGSAAAAEQSAQATAPALAIEVAVDKRPQTLGEPVDLEIRLTNSSSTPVQIPALTDVWVGNIDVFIADASGQYSQYVGPGWGLRDVADAGARTLPPGRVATTRATLLYNHGKRMDHLNAAARAEERSHLPEGFALTRPGIYSVVVIFRGGDRAGDVVSEPTTLVIAEPDGDDRRMWNALRKDPDFAYLLHTGSTMGHPASDKSIAVLEALEAIVDMHPTGRYVAAIRKSMAAHGAAVESLQERGVIAR